MDCSLSAVGVDFLRVQEMVTFNVGDPRQCIDVTILGDDAIEGTERFPLELFSDDADIGQSSAIVTINDDDIPGECRHATHIAEPHLMIS